MLGDISVATNIFIVTGYTDMRKSIDGLCAIVYDQITSEPPGHSVYLFCGNVVIVSKSYFTNQMATFFSTKGSMLCKENTGGLVINQRLKVLHGSNLIG